MFLKIYVEIYISISNTAIHPKKIFIKIFLQQFILIFVEMQQTRTSINTTKCFTWKKTFCSMGNLKVCF